MIHKKVDYATIATAKNGDPTASRILRHYEQYIASFSTRTATDEYGNVLRFVDHEIADRIKAKLMFSIFYYFDLNSMPPEKGGRWDRPTVKAQLSVRCVFAGWRSACGYAPYDNRIGKTDTFRMCRVGRRARHDLL